MRTIHAISKVKEENYVAILQRQINRTLGDRGFVIRGQLLNLSSYHFATGTFFFETCFRTMITSFFSSSEDEIPRFTSFRVGMTGTFLGMGWREATAIRSSLP